MHISNVITTLLGAAAAFQDVQAAPAERTPPGVFRIDDICNASAHRLAPSRMPDEVRGLLDRNFDACMRGIHENRRIFRGSTLTGRQALCAARAGVVSGLAHATGDARSEIQVNRERIYRQLERFPNPLPALPAADASLYELRQINLHDYKHSGSTGYADQLDRQVDLLRAYVPVEHRGSVESARRAAQSADCRAAWSAQVPIWARAEIAERIEMVNVRLVGKPESISPEQASALRRELAGLRLDHPGMARRMQRDAFAALVERQRSSG
jgi:hypothetical protein